MKKFILLVLVVFLVFVWLHRTRLFVRDPLATVIRNGAKEAGAQVYINFNNEVLIENDRAPMYTELVEAGQPIGQPAKLPGFHWAMYLLDAYPATLAGAETGARVESMSNKLVTYQDGKGRETAVTLR